MDALAQSPQKVYPLDTHSFATYTLALLWAKLRMNRKRVESDNNSQATFTRTFDDAEVVLAQFTVHRLYHVEWRTRARRKSNFARPYTIRLINFDRLTCPSSWPLLQS